MGGKASRYVSTPPRGRTTPGRFNMASRRCAATIVALALLVFAQPARAQVVVPSEWNTGNGNWNVAGNWFPNDVPDNGGGFTYDVQIGNRPVAADAAVTFIPEDGTSDSI